MSIAFCLNSNDIYLVLSCNRKNLRSKASKVCVQHMFFVVILMLMLHNIYLFMSLYLLAYWVNSLNCLYLGIYYEIKDLPWIGLVNLFNNGTFEWSDGSTGEDYFHNILIFYFLHLESLSKLFHYNYTISAQNITIS